MFDPITIWAFGQEMKKIAAISSPAIKAIPSPGGLLGSLAAKPAAPVPSSKIIGKALRSTNLQKTNYTAAHARPSATTPLTPAVGEIPPPVVRS